MLCLRFWNDCSGFAPMANALFALTAFMGLIVGSGFAIFTYTDADMPVFLSNLLGR
jgi:hypothetical protein